METVERYLARKLGELELLNACLETPKSLHAPASVTEVVEQKFLIAAALKGEHARGDWAHTETAWTHREAMTTGPFRFSYDYQRADLAAEGPPIYRFEEADRNVTLYTSSGMAAISPLLLACGGTLTQADLLVFPGSYPETLELVESYAPQLRLTHIERLPKQRGEPRPQFLLFDSVTSARFFTRMLNVERPDLDLIVFDTSCFGCASGRVRRVLRWARQASIPIVLVRSHTKLDSLGVEYGRLGSAVFVANQRSAPAHDTFSNLVEEMRKAVRLFGGAAVPAHFPPFVGSTIYRELTASRMAAILSNGRRTARFFASALPGLTAELHFAHGLYVTLASDRLTDAEATKEIVKDLCADILERGLPLRHAGSFGFDFGAAEWGHDLRENRYVVRIAVPDLPTELWDEVLQAIARWWSAHAS